jgi:hypothetical protein
MQTFFHGWRRKTGVATLVMACAAMGVWIRSRLTEDSLVYFAKEDILGLSSRKSELSWTRYTPWNSDDLSRSSGTWVWSHDVVRQEAPDRYEGYEVVWRFQWLGFDLGERHEVHFAKRIVDWTIPYWSIAVPLTLLSVYLILRKPRKRV